MGIARTGSRRIGALPAGGEGRSDRVAFGSRCRGGGALPKADGATPQPYAPFLGRLNIPRVVSSSRPVVLNRKKRCLPVTTKATSPGGRVASLIETTEVPCQPGHLQLVGVHPHKARGRHWAPRRSPPHPLRRSSAAFTIAGREPVDIGKMLGTARSTPRRGQGCSLATSRTSRPARPGPGLERASADVRPQAPVIRYRGNREFGAEQDLGLQATEAPRSAGPGRVNRGPRRGHHGAAPSASGDRYCPGTPAPCARRGKR